jgi:hypothetical protein
MVHIIFDFMIKKYLAVGIIVLFVIFLFIFCLIVPLLHPQILLFVETIKLIPLPSFLVNLNMFQWICEGIKDYFEHTVHYENINEETNKKYIKCLMPHGFIPFSFFCLHNQPFFKKDTYAVSHQLYDFPVLLQYLKMLNIFPVDYSILKRELKNNSLVLYPGGVREAFTTTHKKEVFCIKKRKGIFRLALETGTSIIPIYTFGLTETYQRSSISITLPFFFKNDEDTIAWYFGKYYSLFPIKKKLFTVVGKPIEIKQIKTPSLKDICILRKKYIKEVKRIFLKYKEKYQKDWKTKKIVFR